MIGLRDAQLPADTNAILQLDTSFSTNAIYVADLSSTGILLREIELDQPLTKQFPLDDLKNETRRWDFAQLAAEDDDYVCGFVAAAYQDWNRRLVVSHLYVDRPYRNRGIARSLVDRVAEYGLRRGALNLWLETSNLNLPGIRAYRRMGFELCGADTTLYLGTPAVSEQALFFSRPLVP
jgi:ribosomal protein S18 acetylase RimI-like enzyme